MASRLAADSSPMIPAPGGAEELAQVAGAEHPVQDGTEELAPGGAGASGARTPQSDGRSGKTAESRIVRTRDREHVGRFGVRDQTPTEQLYRSHHVQFGHMGGERLRHVLKQGAKWQKDFAIVEKHFVCTSCERTSFRAQNRPPERDHPTVGVPLARVYVDTVMRPHRQEREKHGQARVATPVALLQDVNFVHEMAAVRGVAYGITLVDEATRFMWFIPMKSKGAAEVAAALDEWQKHTVPKLRSFWHAQRTRAHQEYLLKGAEEVRPSWATQVQVSEDIRLCALHMDVGSEFFADVSAWALERGVDLQPGDPDQPWRNGVVEGRWRDVQALSVKAQLDVTGAQAYNLWLPTVLYAVHMTNIQPTSAPVMYARPHSSPYERLTGEAPQSSWFFKFGEPCWFKDPSRTSKSTPKGVAGYIVGYELMGDRHHRRGFNVLPGDWESTRPTHRRLIIRANVSRDTLATVPLHAGSEYMQPGGAGNPEGVTFSNAPDHPPPPQPLPRNRRQARVPPVSCEAPEQQQVPTVEFPAGAGAPVVTNERAGDDQDAPLRDQEATHRAQQHVSETQTAQEADAHGRNDLSDVVETSELDAPDAPSVGEAETEAEEFQARGVESELADGEFVDAQDDSFLLQGLPEQDVEDPSAFGDADPRDLPALAQEEEGPEPPRRSSRTTAGVPPSYYGHHALPSNPEAGYEALDASKQSSTQRELLAAISAATTETPSGTMLLDARAFSTGRSSKVKDWVKSLGISGEKINVLDCCSGEGGGSIMRTLKRSGVSHLFNVCTVDSEPECAPDVLMKVEDLAEAIKGGSAPSVIRDTHWHIVWTSPPCTRYSAANSQRDAEKTEDDLRAADATVEACFAIIDMLKPICWFLENPDTGANRLRDRPFMEKYKHLMKSVTYCRYGRPDRKATMIVSNVPLTLLDCRVQGQECMTKKLLGRHSRTAQAGSFTAADGTTIPGTPQHESQQVPEALIEHVFDSALHTFGQEFEHALIDTDRDARAQLLVAAARITVTQSDRPPKMKTQAYAILGVGERELGAKVRNINEVPKEEILAAKKKEIDGLFSKEVFSIVHKKDVDQDAQIMSYVWALKVRDDDAVKARLCVGGHRQSKGQNFWEISSPTPRASTVKIALAEASMRGADVYTADVSQAYVAAPIGVRLYMRMPPEMEESHPDSVLLLHMSLYGAKQSGRNWFQEASRILCDELHYDQLQKDPCKFVKCNADGSLRESILLYVDDFLFLGELQDFNAFMDSMSKHVEISAGPRSRDVIKIWNGLEIRRLQDGKIVVTQIAKIRGISRDFGAEIEELERRSSAKATSPEYSNENNFDPRDMIDPKTADAREKRIVQKYQEMVGSLMYVTTYTRFDIAFAMSKASRLMHAASEKHIRGAARIIKYLRDNENVPLVFDGSQCANDGEPKIFCSVDSDFGGEPLHTKNELDMGRRSTSACIIMCSGAPIFWKSKVQKKVALASGEAEFRALSYALKEVTFCIYLLREMGFNTKYVPIFCDASVGVAQAKRDGLSWVEGTKQYEIELSAAYQMCREGMIMPLKIGTDENPADLLTKSDPGGPEVRARHVSRISGTSKEPFQSWIRRQLADFQGSSVSRHGHVSKSDFERMCGLGNYKTVQTNKK